MSKAKDFQLVTAERIIEIFKSGRGGCLLHYGASDRPGGAGHPWLLQYYSPCRPADPLPEPGRHIPGDCILLLRAPAAYE